MTEKYDGEVQVDQSHYYTKQYLSEARFLGLHGQVEVCLESKDHGTFLEIGPGPGLLAAVLRQLGLQVTTIDHSADLKPDLVGCLPNLPVADRSFDTVCAFEVLEHLPWDLLGPSLREMKRIARRRVIISVPDQLELRNVVYDVRLQYGDRVFQRRKSEPLGRITNPKEHYWEIGFNGVTPEKLEAVAREVGFGVKANYFHKPWFRTLVLTCDDAP